MDMLWCVPHLTVEVGIVLPKLKSNSKIIIYYQHDEYRSEKKRRQLPTERPKFCQGGITASNGETEK